MSVPGYHFTAYPDGTIRCRFGHLVTRDDPTDHTHPEAPAMNDTPRRPTAADMLRRATEAARPRNIGRQDLAPLPVNLGALADALDRMHTRATLGDLPVEGNHELYALADAARLARDAALYGYPRQVGAGFGAEVAAEARRSPSARRSDPATSKAAGEAKHREPSHRNQLGRLLLAFRMWEQTCDPELGTGLTSEEAAERAGISLRSEFAKRCSELRDGGYIEPQVDEKGEEVTREGATGRPRIVWHLTREGRIAAANLVDLEDGPR